MFRAFHHHTRGRGHIVAGERGQDRTSYLKHRRVQVICLSDGAGSASHSEFGAQALTTHGVEFIAKQFQELLDNDDGAAVKEAIVSSLRGRLETVAARRGCEVDDLAATFLAVAVFGDHFLIVHIGDGVIGVQKDGNLQVVSRPDNSEFANQTTFVTSNDALASMRLLRGSTSGITGFVLMSDGSETTLYSRSSQQLAPACAKLMTVVANGRRYSKRRPQHEKDLRRFVETVIASGTKDDCSIAILAR